MGGKFPVWLFPLFVAGSHRHHCLTMTMQTRTSSNRMTFPSILSFVRACTFDIWQIEITRKIDINQIISIWIVIVKFLGPNGCDWALRWCSNFDICRVTSFLSHWIKYLRNHAIFRIGWNAKNRNQRRHWKFNEGESQEMTMEFNDNASSLCWLFLRMPFQSSLCCDEALEPTSFETSSSILDIQMFWRISEFDDTNRIQTMKNQNPVCQQLKFIIIRKILWLWLWLFSESLFISV